MPENQIPATQPEAGAAAGEFNFTKSDTENPRIKKRSLKVKPAGLIKPNPAALPAARELEREAPPVTAEQASKPASVKTEEIIARATAKTVEGPTAPPRTLPSSSASTGSTLKIASTATPTAGPASSPHGTRPATLYYTSPTKKAEPIKAETPKTETPTLMKTIPTASAASTSSSASSTPRIATTATTSASRPSANVDYRANVERQSREQKSVGSILSYVVYGLIAFFVISAGLAVYGADVIFKQLHEQSSTVADLDAHYTKLTTDLGTKLSATQDQLSAAQSQVTRQQDVILHQQEQLNQLLTSSTANDTAIKAEKAARAQETATRAQETAAIRSRLKEVEYKTTNQKY